MKCATCSGDINPQWKYAINNNMCPMCGAQIMDEKIKKTFAKLLPLLQELHDNNINQLNDWLLSNFSYAKIGS